MLCLLLVGREEEFQLLRTLDRAGDAGRGSTFLVIGEAGVGKSRLVREVAGLARSSCGPRGDPLPPTARRCQRRQDREGHHGGDDPEHDEECREEPDAGGDQDSRAGDLECRGRQPPVDDEFHPRRAELEPRGDLLHGLPGVVSGDDVVLVLVQRSRHPATIRTGGYVCCPQWWPTWEWLEKVAALDEPLAVAPRACRHGKRSDGWAAWRSAERVATWRCLTDGHRPVVESLGP